MYLFLFRKGNESLAAAMQKYFFSFFENAEIYCVIQFPWILIITIIGMRLETPFLEELYDAGRNLDVCPRFN